MGGVRGTHWRNAYKILVEKAERKGPFGRHRLAASIILKVILKK
jgi:hypothetical protein